MNKPKTQIRYAKFKKVFKSFGEGIAEIVDCKPQISRYILPEEYDRSDMDHIKEITMEEFANNFPNIIKKKNPLENDNGEFPNRLWEYHLSSHKFHIKTNAYLSLGMNYTKNPNGDTYCFYITLFGKYDMDEAYLLDTGWEKTEDSNSVKKEDK